MDHSQKPPRRDPLCGWSPRSLGIQPRVKVNPVILHGVISPERQCVDGLVGSKLGLLLRDATERLPRSRTRTCALLKVFVPIRVVPSSLESGGTLQPPRIANKNTHCPRVLQKGYAYVHRSPVRTVCVLNREQPLYCCVTLFGNKEPWGLCRSPFMTVRQVPRA